MNKVQQQSTKHERHNERCCKELFLIVCHTVLMMLYMYQPPQLYCGFTFAVELIEVRIQPERPRLTNFFHAGLWSAHAVSFMSLWLQRAKRMMDLHGTLL